MWSQYAKIYYVLNTDNDWLKIKDFILPFPIIPIPWNTY